MKVHAKRQKNREGSIHFFFSSAKNLFFLSQFLTSRSCRHLALFIRKTEETRRLFKKRKRRRRKMMFPRETEREDISSVLLLEEGRAQ